MNCCSAFCTATQIQFSARVAARDLARYLRKGPNTTTRLLRDLLATQAAGGTLLDIGAGIGASPLELLSRGFGHATAVDASSAYVAAGRQETERRGLTGAIDWLEGDFVSLATQLAAADVVTLDRVVCCYPAHEPLLNAALDRVRQMVGLSYPRDCWYVRAVIAVENGLRWLRGDAFRVLVHSPAGMAALMRTRGFRLTGLRTTVTWSVEVYSNENTCEHTPAA
jgi:2-polyprenyl-3-methyl-5-hydroxy-6-metoxy-1,4-benzoquinol methylase